jgi:hypothetical protein
MVLSIDKLSSFLLSHKFVSQRWFHTDNGYFLEILSTTTATPLLVFVPSSFNMDVVECIHLVKQDTPNVHKDNVEDFTKISEPFIEQSYNNVMGNVQLPTHHKQPLSTHLDSLYDHSILIEDIQSSNEILKKTITRQLNRLKYCIKGMPHRLAYIHSNIFTLLTKNNDIHMFNSSVPLLPKDVAKMYVVVDIQIMYDKIELINDEADQILFGIYKILNHTQTTHVQNIEILLQRFDKIHASSPKLLSYKEKYVGYINEFIVMLGKWTDKYNKVEMDVELMKQAPVGNLHQDMKRTHQLEKLEKNLENCKKNRLELIKTIQDTRTKNEILALEIDNILFNNIVMIDQTIKNFEKLEKLEQSLNSN